MNLRTLDLNLLVVLDALLDEAHVTRAADRLCLSQSATSAALARCRDLFNDELLERGRGTMRLTPLAQSLRAPLKSVLGGITELIDPPVMPAASNSTETEDHHGGFSGSVRAGPADAKTSAVGTGGLTPSVQGWTGADQAENRIT
ncbi:HTH-type transcriptional regulator LeuO [Cedecea neteri]|uniref:HTH-type transcriptional regulator LeuO n=1 Tax=Cedecea neteri TaxID=158822 RepID=A0A2X3J4Q9_9ENTR|nr:HTH-type transcriptional regulator LeuO [Cedecea neteri]